MWKKIQENQIIKNKDIELFRHWKKSLESNGESLITYILSFTHLFNIYLAPTMCQALF